jgi:hypothetical protein
VDHARVDTVNIMNIEDIRAEFLCNPVRVTRNRSRIYENHGYDLDQARTDPYSPCLRREYMGSGRFWSGKKCENRALK